MSKTDMEEVYALQYAGVPELPKAADKSTPVWIYAIAKVLLYTMRESYVIVAQDYGRVPRVIRTFCDAGIAKTLSVHPYKFLDKRFIPNLEDAAATKKYIAGAYGVSLAQVNALKKDELQRLLYSHLIKIQLEAEAKEKEK